MDRVIVVGGGCYGSARRLALALAMAGVLAKAAGKELKRVPEFRFEDGEKVLIRNHKVEYGSPRSRAGRAARWS